MHARPYAMTDTRTKAYRGATKIICEQSPAGPMRIHIENPYTGTAWVDGANAAHAVATLIDMFEKAVERHMRHD